MTTINNIEDLIKLLDENPPVARGIAGTAPQPRTHRVAREVRPVRRPLTDEHLGRLEADVSALKHDLQEIRDILGALRRTIALDLARERSGFIAEKFGLDWSRTLNREEVRQMVRGLNVGEITQGDRESFGEADIVMEARDSADGTCYVAVEVSYTVDESDTERAIRNAGFLARLTGRPAYAVVAGLRYDDRVMPHIQSGEVTWYQMPPRWLQPE